jgi:DNA-binding response OmpR family regulator
MSDVILVADDDDGIEALGLAELHKPRVAVLDVGMPGLDGVEVLKAIRGVAALAGTKVLLLTAKAQEADVRRGYDAGADAYIKKPFSPAELAARVRELYEAEGAL